MHLIIDEIFDYKKIYGFSNKDMNNLAEITKIWANRESILKDILTDRLLAKDYIQVPYHQHLNDNILRKEISGYYIIFSILYRNSKSANIIKFTVFNRNIF